MLWIVPVTLKILVTAAEATLARPRRVRLYCMVAMWGDCKCLLSGGTEKTIRQRARCRERKSIEVVVSEMKLKRGNGRRGDQDGFCSKVA